MRDATIDTTRLCISDRTCIMSGTAVVLEEQTLYVHRILLLVLVRVRVVSVISLDGRRVQRRVRARGRRGWRRCEVVHPSLPWGVRRLRVLALVLVLLLLLVRRLRHDRCRRNCPPMSSSQYRNDRSARISWNMKPPVWIGRARWID